jgi:lipopolysaccharide export LptBFGC system permease protein LptF
MERRVVLVLVALVVAVIAFAVVSDYVRPLGDALRGAPVVIVGLVLVTGAVLFVALRPRRG